MINTLILGGGGSRISFILGAMSAVKARYEIDTYVGSSAGAVVAACIACGVSPDELLVVAANTNTFNAYSRLREYVETFVTKIPAGLYIQTTDLKTSKRLLTEASTCKTLTDLHSLICASASQPILQPAMSFNTDSTEHKLQADGGAWDSIPAQAAVGTLSVDTFGEQSRVITIETNPPIPATTRRLSSRISQQLRLLTIQRHARTQDETSMLYPEELIRIQPLQRLPSPWLNTRKRSLEMYHAGLWRARIAFFSHDLQNR